MSDLYKLLKSDLHKAAKYEQAAPVANSDRIEELEAKLAKAVDAIDGLLAVLPDDEGPEIDYARATIAELKGEK
jgi:flagellin-specific chaperone FliS